MHELHRGMFARFFRQMPDCVECGGMGLMACNDPVGLLRTGEMVDDVDDPDCVIAWPGCPQKWRVVREWGQDLLPLSECCRWAVEQRRHESRRLPARHERLLREWLTLRELPDAMEMRASQKGAQ